MNIDDMREYRSFIYVCMYMFNREMLIYFKENKKIVTIFHIFYS